MTNNHNNSKHKATFHQPEPIERKIGNTTYIVRAYFNPNAREGVLDQLWRLMKNDNLSL